MNKTLLQIANTIIANLANTEPTGLFNGKMGVCLFLYKYAHYSGSKIYEHIASDMIDEILDKLEQDMNPGITDGLSGIGYGLIELIKGGCLEADTDDDVFHDMDEALLRGIKPLLIKEINSPVPLYSSGIYLLSRIELCKEKVETVWVSEVIDSAYSVIDEYVKKGRDVPQLSLLISMLHIFGKLYVMVETDKNKMESLMRDILYLSLLSIRQKKYHQSTDIALFKQILAKLPHCLLSDIHYIIETLAEIEPLSAKNKTDVSADYLWWQLLYDLYSTEDNSENVISNVDNVMFESYFNQMDVNSKLASIGLWMLSKKV